MLGRARRCRLPPRNYPMRQADSRPNPHQIHRLHPIHRPRLLAGAPVGSRMSRSSRHPHRWLRSPILSDRLQSPSPVRTSPAKTGLMRNSRQEISLLRHRHRPLRLPHRHPCPIRCRPRLLIQRLAQALLPLLSCPKHRQPKGCQSPLVLRSTS